MASRLATVLFVWAAAVASWTSTVAAADSVEFVRDVKPILAQRCFRCHSSLEQAGNLRLDSVPAILKGGDSGAVITPGKSHDSRLLAAVERRGDLKMPPEGEPLTQQQIEVLKRWIDGGAPPPPAGSAAKSDHWAFQKPIRPEIPQVADSAWNNNPIDAFVAAKHGQLNLAPVDLAPPNLLLRRVYLDLIGLPPTAEQLNSYLSETSLSPTSSLPPGPVVASSTGNSESGGQEKATTYEAVVDRLLASPQYGERWGRHWMDVWRYSDWDGYKAEIRESQPHIWRWRDWIVESLNADKPYDQMVQQMLAADELSPQDNDALRATGYLVRSWYKFNRNKWLDDAIEHTGKAFLGLTFNCCRCHDHMYDPLSQRDYYSLRAFFEPYDIRTDRLPGRADTSKDGLVRAFDSKLNDPTFVFVRGNEKNPLKEEPIQPAWPSLLGNSTCSIEPVQLPRSIWYPGSLEFVRNDILNAATKEVENAKTALATAQSKLDTELKKPLASLPSDQPLPPIPPPALVDADSQVALARSTLQIAEATLALNELRLLADDANLATPPKASAKALADAAARAERDVKALQAQKAVLQAGVTLVTARRNKKEGDVRSLNVLTAAENGLVDAVKARGVTIEAFEKPLGDYTNLTPIYPQASSGRRSALARWITSPDNPLAARVAINHIWLRHFGTPLVPSVFDFGLNGKPATNQALLDWLATELMSNGWRMKPLHKLIVTSRTYRLASNAEFGVRNTESKQLSTAITPPSALRAPHLADPENLYYWRANPRRMEAEVVRDATLHLAGSLDLTSGGPDIDPAQGLTNNRRSLYFRSTKEKKVEFLSLFDSANPTECYRRTESIAPQQALAMANSTLTLAQARLLSNQLSASLTDAAPHQAAAQFIHTAFIRILCRPPTAEELAACLEFLQTESAALADTKSLVAFTAGPAAVVSPSTDPIQRARENLVHVLFNHNDFVTIR